MLRSIPFLALTFLVACASSEPATSGPLLRANSEVAGLEGLERLNAGNGAFESGATERFRLRADATVTNVAFSASSGALNTSGRDVDWTLPASGEAELTATLTRRDGSSDTASWTFRVARTVATSGSMSAQQALLSTPMPVLDGGTLEINGGSCEVRYEGTTTNVAIAFTTETHPSLMYGRWNGTAWTLEVVDAMGFNTGGVVRPLVSMQVEASGTPHLVYVRDNTVIYATKVGANWTRERVDTTATYSAGFQGDEVTSPSIVLNGTTPVILYASGNSVSSTRPVVATRTGPGTWSQAVVTIPLFNAGERHLPIGELAIDGAGRVLFGATGYDTSFNPLYRLVAWTSSATVAIPLTPVLTGRTDVALVSPTRVLLRNRNGVYDVALNATFASSTFVYSSVESGSGSDIGDLAWSASVSRPVVLHLHSGQLELVTPNASGFWTYQQLGSTSSVSAGLAVNPSSGEVSVCYQYNGRVMFQ